MIRRKYLMDVGLGLPGYPPKMMVQFGLFARNLREALLKSKQEGDIVIKENNLEDWVVLTTGVKFMDETPVPFL